MSKLQNDHQVILGSEIYTVFSIFKSYRFLGEVERPGDQSVILPCKILTGTIYLEGRLGGGGVEPPTTHLLSQPFVVQNMQ